MLIVFLVVLIYTYCEVVFVLSLLSDIMLLKIS